MTSRAEYLPPMFQATSFHCPNCGVYSHQTWLTLEPHSGRQSWGILSQDDLAIARCMHCNKYSVWQNEQMIFPGGGSAPLPHPEMPEDIETDFVEARGIVAKSPRGAAALLRLAVQRLMLHLSEKGENLNDDIANLVKKGLPPTLRKALDTVRVIGNEAVHPGQIELNDSPEIAQSLFQIVNMIVEKMIAEPKELDALYRKLPPTKLEGIEKRDGGK